MPPASTAAKAAVAATATAAATAPAAAVASSSRPMLSMDQALVGGGLLHVAFTGLLLVKLVWARTCRGVSLGSQELYLVVYTMRNLDLLFLYTGLWTTLRKILEVVAALAIVLLMRYSPAAATYEAEYDSFPRTSLVAPCLVLAFFLNKVKLIIEICHAFSVYLEALALVPQFYMLHKRVAYEPWVLQLTIMIGGERLLQTAAVLMDWTESIKDDPYSVAADITHALVFAGGLALLAAQKVQLKRQQGLNEVAEKPAFDEVWEASKFKFEDSEAGGGKSNKSSLLAQAKQ